MALAAAHAPSSEPGVDVPDLSGVSAWIVTDGKAGDENQCVGIAERLKLDFALRRIGRRTLHLAAPWGPLDPRDAPGREGGALAGDLPEIVIASGRRAVPYLRAVRRASARRCFTVFLKDPRTGTGAADFIWVAEHDDLRGDNVFVTLTAPHKIAPALLAARRENPDPRLAGLPSPRVAVLIGGDSKHLRYGPDDMDRLARALAHLSDSGCALMVTASRRTPPALRAAVEGLVREKGGFFWDGSGENPYLALLALADAVVVTSDSTNMAGEAAATGAPLLLFELPNTYIRHRRLFDGLAVRGALVPFTGRLEALDYAPIDATPVIAHALAVSFVRHRAKIGARTDRQA